MSEVYTYESKNGTRFQVAVTPTQIAVLYIPADHSRAARVYFTKEVALLGGDVKIEVRGPTDDGPVEEYTLTGPPAKVMFSLIERSAHGLRDKSPAVADFVISIMRAVGR
jgi:hypothetical protein